MDKELYESNKQVMESLCERVLDAMILYRLSPDVAEYYINEILIHCMSGGRQFNQEGLLKTREFNLTHDDYEMLNNRYTLELTQNKLHLLAEKIKPRKDTGNSLKKIFLGDVMRLMESPEIIYSVKAFFDSYGLDFAEAKTLRNWYNEEKKKANTYTKRV